MIIYELEESVAAPHSMKIQTVLREMYQNIIKKLRGSNASILNESKIIGLSFI